jgi:hypothetical protein
MRLRWWIIPAIACVFGDLSLLIVALEELPRHAAQLLLGAQIIAVSVGVAVLLLAALVRGHFATAGIASMAVTAGAVAATPVPVTWSDGCNTHQAATYVAAVPYLLVERPTDTRLAFGGTMTLMACDIVRAVPVTMRCPTPVNWPELRHAKTMDARRLVGLRLGAARRLARAHRCSVRVYRLNGEPYETFLDSRPYRINVAVDDGIVTRVVRTG